MKLRNIFASLAAVLSLVAVSCEKEAEVELSDLKVSSSYVAIAAEGETVEITVTAENTWAFDETIPEWLTISPLSGAAGETTVSFTAAAAEETREATVSITCNGQTQNINVIQMTEKTELAVTPIADVIAAGAGTFRVKGTVTSNPNTSYGNYNLTDETGTIYIYGTLVDGSYPKDHPNGWKAFDIEVGDVLTVEGPYSLYGTTSELVDVEIVAHEKSLIKIEDFDFDVLPATDTTFHMTVSSKVSPVLVSTDADWLTVTDVESDGSYVLTAAANDYTAIRTATITVKGPGAIATKQVSQAGIPATGASVTDIVAMADKSEIETLESTVIAKTTKGVVIYDGTTALYVYGSLVDDVKVGDNVKIIGMKDSYNGVPEIVFTDGSETHGVTVYSSGNSFELPEATDITANAGDYAATKAEYVKLTGTLSVSGNYYNLALDAFSDGSKQGSIVAPVDELDAKSFDGKKVTITGWFNGISGKGKYINVITTKIVEFAENPKGSETNPYSVAEIAALILGGNTPEENVYIKGTVSSIRFTFSQDYGTANFWISDDGVANGVSEDKKSTSKPELDFLCYSVYWLDNKPWVDGDQQIELGDEVVICGKTTLYNGLAETVSKKAWVHSVNAGGSTSAAAVTIDGDFADWEADAQTFEGINNRIVEWKAKSDASNLYFYYKMTAEKIKTDGSSKFYVGFNLDNDASTGSQAEHGAAGNSGGLEALAYFYPWTSTFDGVISGVDPDSYINMPVDTATGSQVTVGGKIDGDYAYIEVSMPRTAIGSPAAGSTITVKTAVQYYPTNAEVVTLN